MTSLPLLSDENLQLLIGGEWRPAASGKTFEVIDPADGSSLAEVADASAEDATAALDAAASAGEEWAATPPRERAELLRSAFDLVSQRTDDIAQLMSLEMGKTLAEAKGEVAYGGEFLRWFSEEAVRIHGRWMQAPDGATRLLTVKKPVGPCLFVTPWNFPLAMGTRKIAPALAAGCTMVIKPASQTPLTMMALASVLTEVGLPAGVLNLVTSSSSSEISETLMADSRLRKVSFTGSTGVGRTMVKQSAEQLQRVSMELGGNAPFLVFDDADIDAAVEGAMVAKMRNMGEACTSANRFIVHESVAEEFGSKLSAKMTAMRVGRGQDEGVEVGPMINADAVDDLNELVDEAVEGGATVLNADSLADVPEEGFFFAPRVLTGVADGARVLNEEIFGPVAPIVTFTDEAEAIKRANDTEYGLSSYAYTRDSGRVIRLAEQLQYGMIGMNTGLVSNAAAPFGGMKASGFGREGGFEGIEEYLETTYVALPAE